MSILGLCVVLALLCFTLCMLRYWWTAQCYTGTWFSFWQKMKIPLCSQWKAEILKAVILQIDVYFRRRPAFARSLNSIAHCRWQHFHTLERSNVAMQWLQPFILCSCKQKTCLDFSPAHPIDAWLDFFFPLDFLAVIYFLCKSVPDRPPAC